MSALRFVPRPLRSSWPFRRWFWQPGEVAAVQADTQRLADRLRDVWPDSPVTPQ